MLWRKHLVEHAPLMGALNTLLTNWGSNVIIIIMSIKHNYMYTIQKYVIMYVKQNTKAIEVFSTEVLVMYSAKQNIALAKPNTYIPVETLPYRRHMCPSIVHYI